MAFDRPLEADKIDDLGLFSSFIRAPIVGPIMWMIGGSSAMKKEEEEKNKIAVKKSLLKDQNKQTDYIAEQQQYKHKNDFMNMMQSPDRISSDISDEGDNSVTSLSDEEPNTLPKMIKKLNLDTTKESTNQSLRRSNRDADLMLYKKTRKMSWSDESGQDLVQICDESKKPIHSPSSDSHVPSQKPIKSAIKRSLSSRDSMSNKQKYQPSQCVPSGLVGGKNGINLPTSSGMKNSNGCISPQWGWYISTTPPTPDRYSSKKIKSSGTLESTLGGNDIVQRNNSRMNGSKTPVFTREIKGIPKSVSGWPSVPL